MSKTSVVTTTWADSGDGESDSSSVTTTNTDSPSAASTVATSNGRTTVPVAKSTVSGNFALTAIITATSNQSVALTWDGANATGGPIAVPCTIALPANTSNVYIGANGVTNLRVLFR